MNEFTPLEYTLRGKKYMTENDNNQIKFEPKPSNILDTIMGSQTQTSLAKFEPSALVSNLLEQLKY